MDIFMVNLTQNMVTLIAAIDEFKGQWQALKNISPDKLQQLRQVATVESVGSSTRIEGVKLSDREVEELLSRIDTKQLETRDEMEVVGYADAMEMIYENWEEISLSENNIRQLHKTLLNHSSKDERHKGQYKTSYNNIEAFDEDGTSLGIIFETASPFETPGMMQELIESTNQRFEDQEIHPLIIIGDFLVRFLAIHPFLDGNGRMSRILTTLLLLKSGYLYVPYSSLERIVEENKDSYYRALRKTQVTLKDEVHDDNWLIFFLNSLKKQTDALAKKVETAKLTAPQLPELSLKVLELVKTQGYITVQEAVNATGANRNTLKKQMANMVKMNILELEKKGRSSFYRMK